MRKRNRNLAVLLGLCTASAFLLPSSAQAVHEEAVSQMISDPSGSVSDFSVPSALPAATPSLESVDTTVTISNIKYDLDHDNLQACVAEDQSSSISGALSIPASITYNSQSYQVIGIDDYAFGWNSNITSISLPDGLEWLGIDAFRCASISTLNLPSSLKYIGNYCFGECTNLGSIQFAEGLETIMDAAFIGCTALTGIWLPDSLTYMAREVFNECSSLSYVHLPSHLEEIPETAFANTALTSIEIPDSVKVINHFAFSACRSLSEITWGSGLETIGNRAFQSTAFEEMVIPEGVTSIGSYCFGWASVKKVTFPASLTSLGNECFKGADCIQILAPRTQALLLGTQSGGLKLYGYEKEPYAWLGSNAAW